MTTARKTSATPEYIPDQDDAYAEMRKRLAKGYAPAWRPAPGDSLIGPIVALNMGSTDYGRYPIVTILDTNTETEWAFHALQEVPRSQLVEAAPSIGEVIGVFYGGKRNSKTRKDKDGEPVAYHDYRAMTETQMAEEKAEEKAAAEEDFWAEAQDSDGPAPFDK